MAHVKIDWTNGIIYLSQVLTNKELIQLFTEFAIDNEEKMLEDGPNKPWRIIVVSDQN